MSLKTEAIKKFLTAAKSLANQGMSKEAIIQFAKNEFGEITELFQKQIDNIFRRPASGIEKIKIKDPDFDNTVIKMQFDEEGIPFDPKNPLKYYGKPKKSIKERMDDIKDTSKKLDEAIKEYEDIYKPKKTDDFNLSEDDPLGDLEKIIKGEGDTGLPKKPEDKATGGRAGYQTGNQVMPAVDPRMQNSYDYNVRRNNAERTLNQMSRNYDFSGLSTLGLNAKNYDSTPGPMRGIPAVKGMREKMIQDIMSRNQPYSLTPQKPPEPTDSLTGMLESSMLPNMADGSMRSLADINSIRDKVLAAQAAQEEQYYLTDPISGKQYKSEQEAIDDLGIITYNQRFAKGGRAEYYTGGLVDVEPSLSDIGHGSDALMARTRLLSPGAQGTTSTGLNYLLAEDNDNIRIPFENGKNFEMYLREREQIERQRKLEQLMREYKDDMNRKKVMEQKQMAAEGGRIGFSKGKLADVARRKFMKAAGATGAGIAALKTGLINLAQDAGPKVEMVKETITGAPDYFFDLVSKIKMFGKKSKIGPQERVDEYSYTGANGDDYTLTEDIVTGDARIVKDKTGGVKVGEDNVTDGIANRSVMEYKSGKSMADEGTSGGLADEYDEYEVKFDYDGTEADADDMSEFIKKEIIEEVSDKTTKTKKADGGIAKLLGE